LFLNLSHAFSALGIIFGYVYLLFTTFPEVFGEQYGWDEGLIGLSYLGSGIGFMVGLIIVGATNDRLTNSLSKKYGVRKPEYRMRLMMYFTPLIAIGMFWYGWSADKKAPWYISRRLQCHELTIIGLCLFSGHSLLELACWDFSFPHLFIRLKPLDFMLLAPLLLCTAP